MYTEKKFDIGTLVGLSEKQISEHLKLYAGYVKNVNDLLATGTEITRRIAFEYNGMRLHELYFEQFTESPSPIAPESAVGKAMEAFKKVAMTRGSGWALLVRDRATNTLYSTWVESHEIGHLADTDVIIALDLWEHAFLLDYLPSERAKYIDAFFANINGAVIEQRYGK